MYFWKLITLKNFNEAHLMNVYICAQRVILKNGTSLKSSKNKLWSTKKQNYHSQSEYDRKINIYIAPW